MKKIILAYCSPESSGYEEKQILIVTEIFFYFKSSDLDFGNCIGPAVSYLY